MVHQMEMISRYHETINKAMLNDQFNSNSLSFSVNEIPTDKNFMSVLFDLEYFDLIDSDAVLREIDVIEGLLLKFVFKMKKFAQWRTPLWSDMKNERKYRVNENHTSVKYNELLQQLTKRRSMFVLDIIPVIGAIWRWSASSTVATLLPAILTRILGATSNAILYFVNHETRVQDNLTKLEMEYVSGAFLGDVAKHWCNKRGHDIGVPKNPTHLTHRWQQAMSYLFEFKVSLLDAHCSLSRVLEIHINFWSVWIGAWQEWKELMKNNNSDLFRWRRQVQSWSNHVPRD